MTSRLVSFQLASKHPENIVELFDNLEKTADDPVCFEVLVKIDSEDVGMCAKMAEQASIRPFAVKYLVTPRGEGYAGLWRALNELFGMTSSEVYFVCNINDEVRFKTQGWDTKLRSYVGLFPDDIFRLRTSQLKFRNYYDFWECGYAPENYAFFTRKWLEIVGDWNPCFGPDSSQQYIAYYLEYGNNPDFLQFNRDVPILDIAWGGEGVSIGLTEEQRIWRIATNFRLWMRQVSHPMQEELYRRGRLLQANIMKVQWPGREIEVVTDHYSKALLINDRASGRTLALLSYRLSRVRLFFANLRRTMRYTYYCGGGREAWNFLPLSIFEFVLYYFPEIRFGYQRLVSSAGSWLTLERFRKNRAARPKQRAVLSLNPLPSLIRTLRVHNRVWSGVGFLKKRSTASTYVELNPFRGLMLALRKIGRHLRGGGTLPSDGSTPIVLNLNPVPWIAGKLRVHEWLWSRLRALKRRSTMTLYFELNPVRGFVNTFRKLKGVPNTEREIPVQSSVSSPAAWNVNPLSWVAAKMIASPRMQSWRSSLKEWSTSEMHLEFNPILGLAVMVQRTKVALAVDGHIVPRRLAEVIGRASKPVGVTVSPFRRVRRALHGVSSPVYIRIKIPKLRLAAGTRGVFRKLARPVGFEANPIRPVERALSKLLTPVYVEVRPRRSGRLSRIFNTVARPIGFRVNPVRRVERILSRLLTPIYLEVNPLKWIISPIRWILTPVQRVLNRISRAMDGNVIFNIHHHSRRLAWAIHVRDRRWLKVRRS